MAWATLTHELKGISRPHLVLQAFCSPLHYTRNSPHRFITTTKVHMATSNTTSFYKSKTTNGSFTYTSSSHLHIAFHYGNWCLYSGRRSDHQSPRTPSRLFQQKDVSLPLSFFNIHKRDVCNHRSSKKMVIPANAYSRKCMSPLQQVTRDSNPHSHGWLPPSTSLVGHATIITLSNNVTHVNITSTFHTTCKDYSNLYQYQQKYGKICPWIL